MPKLTPHTQVTSSATSRPAAKVGQGKSENANLPAKGQETAVRASEDYAKVHASVYGSWSRSQEESPMNAVDSARTGEIEMLRRRAALADDLARIVQATHWTPPERITMAALRLAAESGHENGQWRAIDGLTAARVAEIAGVGERTAKDALPRLEAAGVISRHIERSTVNRFGEPIPPRDADKTRGDRWQVAITIALPRTIPETLPELPSSINRQKAKTYAEATRREFADLKTRLDNILAGHACPHCGEVGRLHGEITATCGECGAYLSQDEIAELVDGQGMPAPAPAVQTLHPGQPMLRKLRNLTGRATQPPPATDHDHDDDPGITVELPADQECKVCTQLSEAPATPQDAPEVQSLHLPASYGANFAPSETLSGGGEGAAAEDSAFEGAKFAPSDVLATETLTGAESAQYLAGLGARFSLVQPRSKAGINLRVDDLGAEVNYLDAPVEIDAALRHIARGGSIGILPEHSAGLAVIDVDKDAPAFLEAHPRLALAPRIFRRNAPDRAKIVVFCPDASESRTIFAEEGRKVELIGRRRHAIAAGTHESGAEIELIAGYEVPMLRWADLIALAEAWTGAGQEQAAPPDLSVSMTRPYRAAAVRSSGDQLREAILWYCVQLDCSPEFAQLLNACNGKGKYIAVRADDGTPSTRETGECDGRTTWRDYGSGETLDSYELWCRLTGTDKRRHKWVVVNEWRAAHGKRPLDLNRVGR